MRRAGGRGGPREQSGGRCGEVAAPGRYAPPDTVGHGASFARVWRCATTSGGVGRGRKTAREPPAALGAFVAVGRGAATCPCGAKQPVLSRCAFDRIQSYDIGPVFLIVKRGVEGNYPTAERRAGL